MTNEDQGMRLQRIEIKGLFGIFDHDIPLFMDERITIIHGPNGFGKTTILKMLHDLFSKRFSSLQRVPFTELSLSFENGKRLVIEQKDLDKSKNSEQRSPHRQLNFKLYGKKGKEESFEFKGFSIDDRKHLRFPPRVIDNFVEHLERIGPDQWLDRNTGDVLEIDEVIDRYGDIFPQDSFPEMLRNPKWLNCLLEELDIHFIQTQRLFSFSHESTRQHRPKIQTQFMVVEQQSNDLVKKIQNLLRQYGDLSSSLDRTFPQRVLEDVESSVTEEIIKNTYKEQNEYRDRLMKAGLFEGEKQVPLPERPKGLENMDIRILWNYLEDVKKKFEIFDDLLRKIELFKDIINSRFLYKTFHVDKNEGFIFRTDEGKRLSPASLSSGEQHELVLTYQLLFMVPKNSLLLIDEPEISLHITWQHKFLDDLSQISKLAGLDFIIATRSPSIIHNRTDLEVALKEPANA